MLHAPSATSKVAFFFYYALMVGSYRLRMDTDASISEDEVGSHQLSVNTASTASCQKFCACPDGFNWTTVAESERQNTCVNHQSGWDGGCADKNRRCSNADTWDCR
eukprot:TRINITY_DN2347_c0_g1_i1.p2 TRINITY_DN2347_c0_g1~~TRINITY_DN2347_c0_g1_i1.p2  ORF type:complete len:106 (-),score=6.63 TRINITY_DN2347_c0_g1_i1:31-348(-)